MFEQATLSLRSTESHKSFAMMHTWQKLLVTFNPSALWDAVND